MADIYVRSTTGNDTNDGLTWATAKATLAGAAGIDAAGDTIYVSQAHAESSSSAQAISLAGTVSSPTRVICVDDAAEPPTATAVTATVTTTGASSITISGSVDVYGIAFSAGSGSSTANINLGGSSAEAQQYENCDFMLANTSASSRINLFANAATAPQEMRWRNCGIRFGSAAHLIAGSGRFDFSGISVIAGGTTPTSLVAPSRSGDAFDITFEESDFTNFGAGVNLIANNAVNQAARITYKGCDLPDSWSGSLFSATPTAPGIRGAMYNCQYGATKIYLWEEHYVGNVKSDTAIYRTGGAEINAVPMSLKMATSSLARFRLNGEASNWMERPYPGTAAEEAAWVGGATKTVSVEFVHDTNVVTGQGAGASFAFQNDEFVLEVVTLDTNGSPIGTTHSTAPATILTAASDIASSSETWTTTGMTTPAKQKLSVSIAPQEKGTILARIIGYKASKEIYCCPKITVS